MHWHSVSFCNENKVGQNLQKILLLRSVFRENVLDFPAWYDIMCVNTYHAAGHQQFRQERTTGTVLAHCERLPCRVQVIVSMDMF